MQEEDTQVEEAEEQEDPDADWIEQPENDQVQEQEDEYQQQQQQQQQQQGQHGHQQQPGEEQELEQEQQEQAEEIEAEQAAARQQYRSMVERLEAQLPGNDGSRKVNRAKTETWLPTPEFLQLPEYRKKNFKDYLIMMFVRYACSSSMSQQEVTKILHDDKQPCKERPSVMRDNTPSSFKQLLCALQYFGHSVMDFTHDYDICLCGFMYRYVSRGCGCG